MLGFFTLSFNRNTTIRSGDRLLYINGLLPNRIGEHRSKKLVGEALSSSLTCVVNDEAFLIAKLK